jgi:hypothetical protein
MKPLPEPAGIAIFLAVVVFIAVGIAWIVVKVGQCAGIIH